MTSINFNRFGQTEGELQQTESSKCGPSNNSDDDINGASATGMSSDVGASAPNMPVSSLASSKKKGKSSKKTKAPERIQIRPDEEVSTSINLITRNLQEVIRKELLVDILKYRKESISVYWGTATTGRPHIAYFVPMCKIADMLRAGCSVKILFADLHAYLDSMKSSWEQLVHRVEYYKAIITGMLESINVPLEKLEFVTGTTYQFDKNYVLDMYKLASLTSQHNAQRAGAAVVKQSASPPLSGLLYPLLQWLDEEYLHVDAQFGGVDQRKIFMGAAEYLPKIGYKARAHLMNPMVPGLTGEKMSASDPASKIDILDNKKSISKKINKVFCEPGNIEKNPLIAFVRSVIFLIYDEFVIERHEAEPLVFKNSEDLEKEFAKGEEAIHPKDLKGAVCTVIDKLLSPIRAKFDNDPAMADLIKKAYPQEKKRKSIAEAKPDDASRCSFVVGKIVEVEKHPEADKLFVEKIDIGEEKPRTICSGLVGKVEQSDLLGRMVVIMANLKSVTMRGITSEGMVMCASTGDQVEPIDPPPGSSPGDKIFFEGLAGEPDEKINLKKKGNIWEKIGPDFVTTHKIAATYKGMPMRTDKGVCTAKSLQLASIK